MATEIGGQEEKEEEKDPVRARQADLGSRDRSSMTSSSLDDRLAQDLQDALAADLKCCRDLRRSQECRQSQPRSGDSQLRDWDHRPREHLKEKRGV